MKVDFGIFKKQKKVHLHYALCVSDNFGAPEVLIVWIGESSVTSCQPIQTLK